MRIRMEKRAKLLERGAEAYPVGVERTHSLAEIREKYGHLEADDTTGDTVGVTGRVVFVRNTGKLCFATLQEGGTDGKGTRLQAMLSLANVGEEALADWKALVDLGDHVFIKGEVISSRRGELSVMAESWSMASKALRPRDPVPPHVRRGGNAHPAAGPWRSPRPAVRNAHERVRPEDDPAHRHRAVPQARRGGRHRPRLRHGPGVPQRGRG